MISEILLDYNCFSISRYGRKVVLFPSMTVMISADFASSFVPEYWLFFTLRLIIGIFTIGVTLNLMVMVSELVGSKYRIITFALLYGSVSVVASQMKNVGDNLVHPIHICVSFLQVCLFIVYFICKSFCFAFDLFKNLMEVIRKLVSLPMFTYLKENRPVFKKHFLQHTNLWRT